MPHDLTTPLSLHLTPRLTEDCLWSHRDVAIIVAFHYVVGELGHRHIGVLPQSRLDFVVARQAANIEPAGFNAVALSGKADVNHRIQLFHDTHHYASSFRSILSARTGASFS